MGSRFPPVEKHSAVTVRPSGFLGVEQALLFSVNRNECFAESCAAGIFKLQHKPAAGDFQREGGITGLLFPVVREHRGVVCVRIQRNALQIRVLCSEAARDNSYVLWAGGSVKELEIFKIITVNRRHCSCGRQIRLLLFKRDQDEYKKDLAAVPGTRGDGVLTGAVFLARAGEDITDRQGNILYEKGAVVLENLKMGGEEASVLTEELWPGVYEIVEVTPPTGYQLDETPVRVDTTSAA